MQKRPLKSFRELIAWQRAMSLVDAVLPLAASVPRNRAGLASQMERAAVSISANIAEGYGRASRAEYRHFLSIAAGSLRELETHILVAQRNQLADFDVANRALALADETGRVLHGLRKSLSAKNKRAQRWPG